MNIDQWAYASKLKHIDPMEKMLFASLTLSVCLWANTTIISVLILIMMSGITILRGGIPARIFLKLMMVPMAFLIVSVATAALSVSTSQDNFLICVSIENIQIGITGSNMITAANLFLKALGATSCMYYLSLNTPLIDLLQALESIKVPKLIVELMGLTYRFIFVFLDTVDKIFMAQNARLGYSNIRRGYKSLGSLIVILFIRTYKQAEDIYTALEARGYNGELTVLHEPFKKQWSGYVFMFIVNILFIGLTVFLRKNGDGGVF